MCLIIHCLSRHRMYWGLGRGFDLFFFILREATKQMLRTDNLIFDNTLTGPSSFSYASANPNSNISVSFFWLEKPTLSPWSYFFFKCFSFNLANSNVFLVLRKSELVLGCLNANETRQEIKQTMSTGQNGFVHPIVPSTGSHKFAV